MRDPNRIPEVLTALGQYWMENPDLRLGQIINNAHWKWGQQNEKSKLEGWNGDDVFYFEDDDFLEILRGQLNQS